jgi:5-histidylcysteine sulfoxide synthase
MFDSARSAPLSPSTPVSLPALRIDALDRSGLFDYFTNSWTLYDTLFGAITDAGSFYASPDPLRHPLIFYMGHTAAFYINKLVLDGQVMEGVHPEYDTLFAVGVDPEMTSELVRFNWPPVEAVRAYRNRVFERVADAIATVPVDGVIDAEHPVWAILMGIEHERIHFETSSMLLRQHPAGKLTPPPGWLVGPRDFVTVPNDWVGVPAGPASIGRPGPGAYYAWDSDCGRRDVDVRSFEASRHLVSNAEYVDFVLDGGYRDESLWTGAGWAWRRSEDREHPKFWGREGDAYRYRAVFEEFALPLSWPAEVTAHEAEAYCRWKGGGARLLGEAEWTRLTVDAGEDPDPERYNLNLRFGSPGPCGLFASDGSEFSDLFGNVWTWLGDDFGPLPGFRPHPLYEEFSAPFFDDHHAVLRGGSWAALGAEALPHYRNWFRRGFHQHAGFRLARDV